MSVETEILRLKKSKDMVAAAEKLKLSGVRKWRHAAIETITANTLEHRGGSIYAIGGNDTITIDFRTGTGNVQNDEVCIVILPIDKEHIGKVEVRTEMDDPITVITEDMASGGIVSYDHDITLAYDYGSVTIETGTLPTGYNYLEYFIAIYYYNGSYVEYDDEGNVIEDTEYIDGTEKIDELAMSLYHYEPPINEDTSGVTAVASDAKLGTTFYANGKKVVGSLSVHQSAKVTVDSGDDYYVNGNYVTSDALREGIYNNCTVGLTDGVKSTLTEYDEAEAELASI